MNKLELVDITQSANNKHIAELSQLFHKEVNGMNLWQQYRFMHRAIQIQNYLMKFNRELSEVKD